MLKLRRRIMLPSIMTSKARRLLPVLGMFLLFVLLLHLYSRSQVSTAHACSSDSSLFCRAFGMGQPGPSEGYGRPIVDRPEGVGSPSVWGSRSPMLEGVNDVWSDILHALAGGPGGLGLLAGWKYERDAENLDLSRRQCLLAFPGLFVEIDRARARYEKFHITESDLGKIRIGPGRMRAGILGGELQILETHLPTPNDRARALAFLRSINDAASRSTRTKLPGIEFVISVNPHVPDLTYPIWVPDRRAEDGGVWLAPDTGFVVEEAGTATGRPTWADGRPKPKKAGAPHRSSADEEGGEKTDAKQQPPPPPPMAVVVTPRKRLLAEIKALERDLPYEAKPGLLAGVWRAGVTPDTTRYRALVYAAEGRRWARRGATPGDQAEIAGAIEDSNSTAKGGGALYRPALSSVCGGGAALLAHDDGFDGPAGLLDGPLLCASAVVVTTRPRWLTPYHGLMLADTSRPGPGGSGDGRRPAVVRWVRGGAHRQNVVLAADDWADLDDKVRGLAASPGAAARIAANAARTFGARYLAPAATACYWREMAIAYRRVGFEPRTYVEGEGAGKGREGREGKRARLTIRGISFDAFLMLDSDIQARFHEDMMLRKAD